MLEQILHHYKHDRLLRGLDLLTVLEKNLQTDLTHTHTHRLEALSVKSQMEEPQTALILNQLRRRGQQVGLCVCVCV